MAKKLYKLHSEQGVEQGIIRNNDDGSITHFQKHNYEWEQYQEWLDDGNTPEPADE